MLIKSVVAAAALTIAALGSPGVAVAAPTHHAAAHAQVSVDRQHRCTHTSSGSCIRGGEFCPQASYGHSGWDAHGRRYVCKGNHTHPHWMKP